jgi:hypothetical protein
MQALKIRSAEKCLNCEADRLGERILQQPDGATIHANNFEFYEELDHFIQRDLSTFLTPSCSAWPRR